MQRDEDEALSHRMQREQRDADLVRRASTVSQRVEDERGEALIGARRRSSIVGARRPSMGLNNGSSTRSGDGNENANGKTRGEGGEAEPERRKSIGKRIGGFIGTAFTGYNMKSDGKGNVERW
jgi:hypothetical protein